MMQLKPHPRFWMVLLVLVSLAVGAKLGYGSDITYSNIRFNDPFLQFAVNNDSKISGATINGEGGSYSLSAELCQTGYCTGDSSITSQLRLTNLSLTCTAGGGTCDPIDISFQADGSTGSSTTTFDFWLDNGTFSGPGTLSGQSNICIVTGSNICSATGQGQLSSSFPVDSNINGNLIITFSPNSSFTVVGDLHLDGLSNGATLTLGNSLEITALTPEPSPIFLLPVGLGVLALLRRRLSAAR